MTTENKKITSFLRSQYQGVHLNLEGTAGDVTAEQARWTPPGKAQPLGANYAHAVISEDMVINGMLRGGPPLAVTSWVGRTGVSALPPEGFEWSQWAKEVEVDLPALRQYAQAVYANTDEFLASLSDDDLNRPLDMSAGGLGQQTHGWMINIMLEHAANHCGEISCLKGFQGAKGYPM